MSGINPYIAEPESRLPQLSYRVTFLPEGKTLEVIPGEVNTSEDGLPGSLLSLALGAGLDLDHSCGGVCACSTCHVYVDKEWTERLKARAEDEQIMVEDTGNFQDNSRLACQIDYTEHLDGIRLTLAPEF